LETIVKQPLTALQLELLKLFARNISENDLLEIKQFLVKFFAEKAMDSADEIWKMNNWTEVDEIKMLNEHNRTPYKV
jgi:hypothetical protein